MPSAPSMTWAKKPTATALQKPLLVRAFSMISKPLPPPLSKNRRQARKLSRPTRIITATHIAARRTGWSSGCETKSSTGGIRSASCSVLIELWLRSRLRIFMRARRLTVGGRTGWNKQAAKIIRFA
ncbi:hypothetical protein D3C72_1961810 [compost metagenome]